MILASATGIWLHGCYTIHTLFNITQHSLKLRIMHSKATCNTGNIFFMKLPQFEVPGTNKPYSHSKSFLLNKATVSVAASKHLGKIEVCPYFDMIMTVEDNIRDCGSGPYFWDAWVFLGMSKVAQSVTLMCGSARHVQAHARRWGHVTWWRASGYR